jgi:hypothetical protein
MSDNVQLNPGAGGDLTRAIDRGGGVKVQADGGAPPRIKIVKPRRLIARVDVAAPEVETFEVFASIRTIAVARIRTIVPSRALAKAIAAEPQHQSFGIARAKSRWTNVRKIAAAAVEPVEITHGGIASVQIFDTELEAAAVLLVLRAA